MTLGAALRYVLQRRPSGEHSTVGDVLCAGAPKWFTCEDVVREPADGRPDVEIHGDAALDAWVRSWKIDAETAIPSGSYPLVISKSRRLDRETIEVVGVPGFTGIRIHKFNKASESKGCIGPGKTTHDGEVYASGIAESEWFDEVKSARLAGREVWLDVQNAEVAK